MKVQRAILATLIIVGLLVFEELIRYGCWWVILLLIIVFC